MISYFFAEKMSETESDPSCNDDEEEEGDEFLRLKFLVKQVLITYFFSEVCTSRIKDDLTTSESADTSKILVYNNFQIGINTMLKNSILKYPLFDEDTMSILEEEARKETENMSNAMFLQIGNSLPHNQPPEEQMLSTSASISDGDASTSSVTSSEPLETESTRRREREASEADDNPVPQQRRRVNDDEATSLVRAETGKKSRKGQGQTIVYDEEEVKLQVRNVVAKVKESYASLNHGREVPIGIASDSRLLQMAACNLMEKIRSGDGILEAISSTLGNALCVSESTYTCRSRLISILRGEASALGTLPTYDSRRSMGLLLAMLDENKSVNELKVLNNVGQMTGEADAVRHVDSIEKNMDTELLKSYATHDQAVKNILHNLANVWTGAKVLSLWQMNLIFKHLTEQDALNEKARALYGLKFEGELDESMSVLEYLKEVLIPLSDTQEYAMEAVKLLLVIRDVLTNFGNTRVRKEQQPMRKDMILGKFSLAQSMDINGNVVSEEEDHLGSGSERRQREREREAVNAVFNLVMEKQIEKKLPAQLLESRGGFALGTLRLSSSDVARYCNKFTPEFLFGTSREGEQTEDALRHVYGADDEKLKGLKAAILKKKYKKNDTSFQGEKKIVIFTAAQMKSFEDLGDFATRT